MTPLRLLAAALALAVAACGGTGENIDRLGCQYLEQGPFTAVTAGLVADATAPAITADHMAFTVTLPATGVGYLAFASLDDTDYAIFLDRTVPFALFDAGAAPLPLSASGTSSSQCTIIQGRHIFELPITSAYFGLGPDAGGPVNVVLEVYNPD